MPETMTVTLHYDISVQGYPVAKDSVGRDYVCVPGPQDVQKIYKDHQVRFWQDIRSRTARSPEEQKAIIGHQAPNYKEGTKSVMARYLADAVARVKAAGRTEISILELGCANGPTLRHLKETAPDMSVRFFGLELTDFLVDDLVENFPDAKAIVAGAEEFLTMMPEDLGSERFDVFLAAGVLCQVPPSVARDVITHVAGFCDEIIMWDYLLNMDGRLSADDAVIFFLDPALGHILFLNQYRKMLVDAGYGRIDFEFSEITHSGQAPEEGSLRAY